MSAILLVMCIFIILYAVRLPVVLLIKGRGGLIGL